MNSKIGQNRFDLLRLAATPVRFRLDVICIASKRLEFVSVKL